MPLAYLDCFAGLSGDLFLGALTDLGYPNEELRDIARRVVGDRATLTFRREARHGVTGVRVIVEPADAPAQASHAHHLDHGHEHHSDHHHPHPHASGEMHAAPSHGHTLWREIRDHLRRADLPPTVRDRSLAAFERLAVVEGRIHGLPTDDVAFHEVGAVDALVDIVGTVAGVEALALDPIVCAPPVLGQGFVRTQHGTMPVPAPATLALLEGFPVRAHSPAPGERTTPTGATLATTLAARFGRAPEMVVRRVGYGVATADPIEVPNLLRIWVGDPVEAQAGTVEAGLFTHDSVDVVEAEIDDMNPEIFGHLAERLRDAGALDVVLAPVQMKKGRPGTSIRVLAADGRGGAFAELLLRESTSTGARVTRAMRWKLPREIVSVDTPLGVVRAKVVHLGGGLRRIHPEYEDLRRIATERAMALIEVERRVVAFLEGSSPSGAGVE